MPSAGKTECAGYLMLRKNAARHIPDKSLKAACHGAASLKFEGENYCVMHAPTQDKAAAFEKALSAKLAKEDFNFRGVWFPGDVNFADYHFTRGANFSFAVISGTAVFSQAKFTGSEHVYFIATQFLSAAKFDSAQFTSDNVSFRLAQFHGFIDFSNAAFNCGSMRFNEAQFNDGPVYFINATFNCEDIGFAKIQFNGDQTDFSGARFSGRKVNFLKTSFTGAAFSGAQFNEINADFRETQFDGEAASFDKVQFSGAIANFGEAKFTNVSFRQAQFSESLADFRGANFTGGRTDFGEAQFSGGETHFNSAFQSDETDFSDAQFSSKEADFAGAQFNKVTFYQAKFSAGKAKFTAAQFTGGDADFNEAQFSEDAFFSEAQFGGKATFKETQFNGGNTYLDKVGFKGSETNFRKARFSENVYFTGSNFTNYITFDNAIFGNRVFFDDAIFTSALIDFTLAQFANLARFIQCRIDDSSEFYFGEAIFETPDQVYFSSMLNLQLRWFVNTDTRNFIYEDVEFPALEKSRPMSAELENARKLLLRIKKNRTGSEPEEIGLPYKPLITVLRRMADNAEENSRYEYASTDRKMAFEIERLERKARRIKWFEDLRNNKEPGRTRSIRNLFLSYPFGLLQFLYRGLSGYGESWGRALSMIFVIWVFFAVLYLLPFSTFSRWDTRVSNQQEYETAVNESRNDQTGRGLQLREAFSYSFGVMSLQKPDPKPLGIITFALVSLETALGPIQAALLALAIRRKFMR